MASNHYTYSLPVCNKSPQACEVSAAVKRRKCHSYKLGYCCFLQGEQNAQDSGARTKELIQSSRHIGQPDCPASFDFELNCTHISLRFNNMKLRPLSGLVSSKGLQESHFSFVSRCGLPFFLFSLGAKSLPQGNAIYFPKRLVLQKNVEVSLE